MVIKIESFINLKKNIIKKMMNKKFISIGIFIIFIISIEGCNVNTNNDYANEGENKIIDCETAIVSQETAGDDKSNLDCFIDAARDCSPAKIVIELEINAFGVTMHYKNYQEIKGLEDDRCVIFNRVDDFYYDYPKETREYMLDSGVTEEEIKQEILELNELVQEDIIGKDSTCKYPIDYLVSYLEDTKQGSFSGMSTDDVEKYECTGSSYDLYETGGGNSNSDIECSPCENCVSGSTKKVMTQDGEVCYECTFDSDCKEGFHCFDHMCLSNDVLKDNPSCEGFEGYVPNDPCKEYACETCEKGYMVCQGGSSNWPSDIRYKCIECDDFSKECVEGYVCKEYECVPE